MKYDASKLLQKKKKNILEQWMKNQLSDESLREDMMSNEELRGQSEELLDTLLKSINEQNLDKLSSNEFEPVYEVLSGISITRARQGFTPRETGAYVFSLKEALLQTLQAELKE